MKAQLLIKKLPSNYLLASMATPEQAPSYITSSQGKPLKFLSISHIKEYFEGQRIDEIFVVDEMGEQTEVEYW